MNNPLKNLQPESVWSYFYEISQIPRCSGHEERIIEYLKEFASENNLEYKTDKAGNICIKKKAYKGFESRPGVVLQGHVDMVCEKNRDTEFNFMTEPIRLTKDGDWIKAEGTTLGADNGIAVAMAMAVLADKNVKHGPLEALFTVDEETGLTGATNLDPSIVDGRVLINIDSEEEGIIYIGCAGGITTIGKIETELQAVPSGRDIFTLRISGLRGGHSGADIHEGRGNSIVMGARILHGITKETDIIMIGAEGGDKHNAIPREFSAVFAVRTPDKDKVLNIVEEYKKILVSEYGDIEPGLTVDIDNTGAGRGGALTREDSEKIISTLFILPHGVIGMSRKLPGLVETSTNLAAVHLDGGNVTILTSQRSSVMSALDHIAEKVRTMLENAGADITLEGQHPAWEPDPDSKILKTFKDVYRKITSSEPEVTAIHAGLECGVLGEKFPGMEMISFGPDMEDVHTPGEKLSIPSVQRTWNFLLEVLGAI